METIILSLVIRNKEHDKENKLKGIGMTMLCSLLTFFKMEQIKYIYLDATTSKSQINKLISLYKSFGFVSIDPKDPKKCWHQLRMLRKVVILLETQKTYLF